MVGVLDACHRQQYGLDPSTLKAWARGVARPGPGRARAANQVATIPSAYSLSPDDCVMRGTWLNSLKSKWVVQSA